MYEEEVIEDTNYDKDTVTNDTSVDIQPKKRYTGKHINKKLIIAIVSVFALFLLYNILKTPSSKKKEDGAIEQKKEGAAIESKNTLKDIKYRDISYENFIKKDVEEIKDTSTPISDISSVKTMSDEEKNRLAKQKELEDRGRESPIGFTRNIKQAIQSTSPTISDIDIADPNSNRSFFKEKNNDRYLNSQIIDAVSPYTLTAGDFIPAVIISAINSDLPTRVITAQVSENILDSINHRYLLIPMGTKIIGKYSDNVTFGQERLLIIWQRLIFPNGSSIDLENMQGVDLSGQVGITGKVNNHFATLLKGVILSSALGAAGAVVTDNDDNWRNAAASGAGTQIIEIGDKFAQKALERKPTINIRTGERFNIMIHSDMILKPYNDRRNK